jgi:hypothetical protein
MRKSKNTKSASLLPISILSLALFLLLSSTTLFADIPPTQRAALIDFYNSTNGDSWTSNDGWKTPPFILTGSPFPAQKTPGMV